MYDASIGKFANIDRFAEKYSFQSPYAYAANNPISFIDVNGDSLDVGGNLEASLGDVQDMVSKKYRNRLSYNEVGNVSLNTDGLERNKKGEIKNSKLRALNEIITDPSVKILYINAESALVRAWNYKTVGTRNADGRYKVEIIGKKHKTQRVQFADFARSRTSRTGAGDWYDGTALSNNEIAYGEVLLPPQGYDGIVVINPGLRVEGGRISVAKHGLREAYFMAKGQSYKSAHRNAGNNGSPKWWYIINSDGTRTNGWGNR